MADNVKIGFEFDDGGALEGLQQLGSGYDELRKKIEAVSQENRRYSQELAKTAVDNEKNLKKVTNELMMMAEESDNASKKQSLFKSILSGAAKETKTLSKSVSEANDKLKEKKEALDDSSNSLSGFFGIIKGGINDFRIYIKSIREANKSTEKQGRLSRLMGKGFQFANIAGKGLGLGLKIVGAGLRVVAIGFASIGIGLVIQGFALLVDLFKETAAGSDKMQQIFAAIGGVFEVLIKRALVFAEALVDLVSGNFSDAANKAKEAFAGLADEIGNAAKNAQELKKAEQALTEQSRALDVAREKEKIRLDELKAIQDNRTKSTRERIKAIQDEQEIDKKFFKEKIAQAEESLRIEKERNKNRSDEQKDLDTIAEAEILLTKLIRAKDKDERLAAKKIQKIKTDNFERAKKAQQKELKRLEAIERANREIEAAVRDRLEQTVLSTLGEEERIKKEEEISLRELRVLEETAKKRAEAAGKTFELEQEFAQLRQLVKEDTEKRLKELEQKRLNDRLANLDLEKEIDLAELEGKEFQATQLLTAEEVKQKELLHIQREAAQTRLAEIEEQTGKEFELQRKQLQAEIKKTNNDQIALNKNAYDRRINQQEALALSEVELLTDQKGNLLTLEEEKERARLEIQIKFAKQRLALLRAELGDKSPEVQILENTIESYENALEKIGESELKGLDKIKARIKAEIIDTLGISEEEFDEAAKQVTETVTQIAQQVYEGWVNGVDGAIEENKRLIDSINEQIDVQRDVLNAQLERQKQGLSNNVDAEREALDKLTAQREAADEKQRKLQEEAQRREEIAATITQTINLISASSKIFNALAGIPFVGVPLAIGLIAAMFGAFIAAKKDAAAASSKFYTGGRIPKDGRDDRTGRGHQIEDTNIVVGRGEWVVNAADSEEHNAFLNSLNAGAFRGVDLAAMAERGQQARLVMNTTVQRVTDTEKKVTKARTKERQIALKGAMKEAFAEILDPAIDRLIKSQEEREQVVPLGENKIMTVKKKGGATVRRKINLK